MTDKISTAVGADGLQSHANKVNSIAAQLAGMRAILVALADSTGGDVADALGVVGDLTAQMNAGLCEVALALLRLDASAT